MFTRATAAGLCLLAALSVLLVSLSSPVSAGQSLVVYSYREPGLIAPLLNAFKKKTGITTNVVYAKKGLNERVLAEGRMSPVDVILTVDVARLSDAKEKGITQPIASETIDRRIPTIYRDPDGHWVGLSLRARLVYASKSRVDISDITYENLADEQWHGRICSRSGQHSYNIGLLASLVAHLGEEKATQWARAVKNNLARRPSGGDRDQVKAIFAGVCDIAIGNSYYMAAMQTNDEKPEQKTWAASVKLLFPNAKGRGTHVNISGAAIAKYAPDRDAAIAFLEFLTSDEGQQIYAQIVNEYPLKKGVAVSDRVASWGELKPDSLSLIDIAKYRKTASQIMDRVNFDAGPE